jgi:hypothetical protein
VRPIVKALFPPRETPAQPHLPERPVAAATAYSQRELVRWSLLVCPDPEKERS